jgi:nucleoside-diphosphate-sugar epimerase
MRVFFAGASGVIGKRLLPALLQAGHEVTGMTRTPAGFALPEPMRRSATRWIPPASPPRSPPPVRMR